MSTPFWRQYLNLKRQYPDCILLYRLGDFYESFDQDAAVVADVCDVVLTSRPLTKDQRIPMAGVPFHALEPYLTRLINAGHKVAIAEQIGDPSDEAGRGLMAREVTRVVTPGTVVEPGLLEPNRNNYLAAVVLDGDRAGLAYTDISTGEFAATQLAASAVRHELERLQPAEVIVEGTEGTEETKGTQGKVSSLGSFGSFVFTSYPRWHFDLDACQQALREHFAVATLDGFGCAGLPLAVRAAGAILQYLRETQRTSLAQIATLRTYSASRFMVLDAATRRNLELTATIRDRSPRGSLLGVLDATLTPMGGRLLAQWIQQPLLDIGEINARLDAVAALHSATLVRATVRAHLKGLADLERLTNRVVTSLAGPKDLIAIRKILEQVSILHSEVPEGIQDVIFAPWRLALDVCTEIIALLKEAIAEDAPAVLGTIGVILPGFSAELDGIRAASKDAREWVATLEQRERERTGIRTLKVGYNKVFGYYIEVTRANAGAVPADYQRKQTLVNAERYITPELKEYESLILNADERIIEVETRLFREVCSQVAAAAPRLLGTARALAHLDVFAALAEVAARHNYVRPVLDESQELDIVAGRHPVVELTLKEEPFVPNDCHLDKGEIMLITGPNMAGKSVYLRQTALIVLMAQIGSFVPADSARIGLVDRIFTRIGAQDEIAAGQSTFMVEMVETATLLSQSTPRSLLILDEVGRGTSTYDGLAIARAVVEFIHNHPRLQARTLFATHYHELTELEKFLPRVRNYNVAVAEDSHADQVVFLHHIVPGSVDRSYGIYVAKLAGIPKPVIDRAQAILKELEDRQAERRRRNPIHGVQLALPVPISDLEAELARLDVLSMTPLEALNKLYELSQRARGQD